MPSTISFILFSIILFDSGDNDLESPVINAYPGSIFSVPSAEKPVTETTPLTAGLSFRETIDCKELIIWLPTVIVSTPI